MNCQGEKGLPGLPGKQGRPGRPGQPGLKAGHLKKIRIPAYSTEATVKKHIKGQIYIQATKYSDKIWAD